jgi:hypothetical protein
MDATSLSIKTFRITTTLCITKNATHRIINISGLYYKCFMSVIYDRNDSGQYFKTTIMIVADNPS